MVRPGSGRNCGKSGHPLDCLLHRQDNSSVPPGIMGFVGG
jgi:hypothetical protein